MITHEVEYFMARVARTVCGIYVDDDKIAAYNTQPKCKNCRRILPKPRRFQGTRLT